MNRKKDILLDAPCPELLCGLCTDILEDPMQVHCSEDHMFCSSCLADYKDSTCPSCMEPLDKSSFQLSKFVKRQISRLRVCCVHQSLGCIWEGILENFDSHFKSCQYQSIPCPNSHNGCPDYIKPSDIYQHKSQCLYELIPCQNGSLQCQPFLRKDSTLHDSTCSSFQCPFAHEGCPFTGTLTDTNQHCENYCGKLHERIKHLEEQCNQMTQQLHHQHETIPMDNIVSDTINDTSIPTTTPIIQDDSMNEMTLFHQMFNNGIMSNTPEHNDTNVDTSMISNSNNKNNNNNNDDDNNTEMMDLSACLSNIPFPTTAPIGQQHQLAEGALDTLESRMAMTLTAPKRSSTGKIIRYSKNKHLAHGALRMARQRTSSGSNLTTDSILHALHGGDTSGEGNVNMASSSPPTPSISTCPSLSSSTSSTFPAPVLYSSSHHQQQQHQPVISTSSSLSSTPVPNLKSLVGSSSNRNGAIGNPTYSFKNLDDVTKFLEELPPPLVDTTPSSEPRKPGPTKPNTTVNNERTGKSIGTGNDGSTKQSKTPIHISNPSQQVMNDELMTNKSPNESPSRPMYVLASTLLSKRGQGN